MEGPQLRADQVVGEGTSEEGVLETTPTHNSVAMEGAPKETEGVEVPDSSPSAKDPDMLNGTQGTGETLKEVATLEASEQPKVPQEAAGVTISEPEKVSEAVTVEASEEVPIGNAANGPQDRADGDHQASTTEEQCTRTTPDMSEGPQKLEPAQDMEGTPMELEGDTLDDDGWKLDTTSSEETTSSSEEETSSSDESSPNSSPDKPQRGRGRGRGRGRPPCRGKTAMQPVGKREWKSKPKWESSSEESQGESEEDDNDGDDSSHDEPVDVCAFCKVNICRRRMLRQFMTHWIAGMSHL